MPPKSEEPDDHQPLLGRTILFAEDEARLRTIVSMMLEELGAQVVEVENGISALEAYKNKPDKFDLVFLDMRMKGLGGDAAFLRLLELDPEVKVVLSSGIAPDNELMETLEKHGGGFIEKPFNISRLGDVLNAVIHGK